jgi:outer membrane receptor for ferrienterochelin and colicins
MQLKIRNSAWIALSLLVLAVMPASAQTGVIAGRVTDVETGAPVVNASVHAVRADGTSTAPATTTSDGRFRLSGVTAGSYTLFVTVIGFEQAQVANVTLAPGQTTDVAVTIRSTPIAMPALVAVGTRQAESYIQTPVAMTVVSREEVEETPALQPFEHLAGQPGIDFARTGLFTSTVVARGFSNVFSTSLLAITDHRYTNVPSLRVNTGILMPTVNEDVERIEVLLGPGSAVYGPNAANGVMHILTQSPFSAPGTTVALGGGERDLLTGALRHAGVLGDRFGYKITGQYMRGQEWPFIDQEEVDARVENPAIPARDNELVRWSGELRADYRVANNADLIFTVGRVTADNAIEMTPFGAAQARGWDYTYYQARFQANRLFAQTFLNTSNAGNTILLRTGEPIVDESRLFAVQLQHSTPFGERQDFTYGIDVQRTDPRTGGTIHGRFEDDDDSNEVGGYVVSRTRLTPQLNLQLAARYDYHSRVPDNVLSPRAALVFSPSENQAVRATYNRAFGTPLNSQLFLDLQAGTVGALPFQVRAIGGSPGYTFRRDCVGGICIRSPFPAAGEAAPNPSQFRDLDATRFWAAATNILFQSSGGTVDIRMIPAPNAAQVGTVLRLLNPHPAGAFFETVDAASLTDIAPLVPSISNTFEVGYKGILGGRMLLAMDVWHQRRNNFVSAAIVETPNMFLERGTLTAYLSNFMGAQQAGQIAAAMAGIDNNPAVTGIPLGTAGFDHPLTADQHVYLTYRNYGDVQLWGSDIAAEFHLPANLTLSGTYSWLSDDTFRTIGAGPDEVDVLLNAPANKGSLGLRWSQPGEGVTVNSKARFVDGFPMNSGVYVGTVDSYTVVDLGVTWRIPRFRNSRLAIQAQNVFDSQHQQFIGAPSIGRLITGRVTHTF